MTRAGFIAKLKASLHDAARVLDAALDADFERITDNALAALSLPDGRPLLKRGSVTLAADTYSYAAPADLLRVRNPALWGRASRGTYNPWDDGWLARALDFNSVRDGDTTVLRPSYAPDAGLLALHGSACEFLYYARHQLTAGVDTVNPADELILLTRAQAEAMLELAVRNYAEPVRMMGGADDLNGSPQQVYEMLIRKYMGLCRS